MTKSKRKAKTPLRSSRLGFKIIGMSILAFVAAIGVYYLFSTIGNHIADTKAFKEYFEQSSFDNSLAEFQKYITENNVRSSDYSEIRLRLTDNRGVGFLFDGSESGEGEYMMKFADKEVSVTPYVFDSGYSGMIETISVVIAFACFFWILFAFLRDVAGDIKRLSDDLKYVTEGDLDREIKLSRKDELGSLANDINIMQRSLIERMEAERSAINANRELITSLSHDLRTPLTKQMCEIELALKGGIDDEKIMRSFERIYRHSQQIKTISDELFSYFLAEKNAKKAIEFEEFDGQTLLRQLASEYSDFLIGAGFNVKNLFNADGEYQIVTDISCLMRIVDNLASNVKKYADNKFPVEIYCAKTGNFVYIGFSNHINSGSASDSSNIGINSAKQLARTLGGDLKTYSEEKTFHAELFIPITQ